MLSGLVIRDVVLADRVDLSFGPGLTVLTGETGAGKSIILDALGLALGARADAGLVRAGANQASAAAVFSPPADHPVWAALKEKGVACEPGEDLVLRRALGADGRSRAFVNDQPVGVAVVRELAEHLVRVNGQHDAVGLLDARSHGPLLDAFGRLESEAAACAAAWAASRAAVAALAELEAKGERAEAERGEAALQLAELDRLAPQMGEEAALAEERALLGAAEKTLADIEAAREALGGDAVSARLGQAWRALGRARERALGAGVDAETPALARLAAAADAADRAMAEAAEAEAAVDTAAEAFAFDPARLEATEARLFDLRAAARRLGLNVDDLPEQRTVLARRLAELEDMDGALVRARAEAAAAQGAWRAAAAALSNARRAASERLARSVQAEMAPLKLGKARFGVEVEPLPDGRGGAAGCDRIEFQAATLVGAPFAPLTAIASGGELARFSLAISVNLSGATQPAMIFDEVDQGVGGAVADAVGQRLARLAEGGQVIVVTHSPQVAARATAHFHIGRTAGVAGERSTVEVLDAAQREEEIARMLSGERVTEAARAAARALIAA